MQGLVTFLGVRIKLKSKLSSLASKNFETVANLSRAVLCITITFIHARKSEVQKENASARGNLEPLEWEEGLVTIFYVGCELTRYMKHNMP